MRRIALYSHDAQGLGHMRRNLAIASVLADARPSSILLIAGAREAARFPLPPCTDTLALPALRKDANGRYASRSLGLDVESMVDLRAATLHAALAAFQPDVMIVDKLPSGVHGELATSFGLLARMGTKLVLGMREVLDEPDRVHAEWDADGALDVLRRHYHAVWVYGDPRVYDPVVEYDVPADVARMVRYSGYIDRLAERRDTGDRERFRLPGGRLSVCLVGGGEDGHRLADAFARCRLPEGATGVVVTGPFMPTEQRERLEALVGARDDMRLLDFLPDADALIALADDVISMGGYNTSCEILASGRRALIVPRVEPRREQLIRARRLSALGSVDLLEPQDLTAGALTGWLAASDRRPHRRTRRIDMGGLRRLPVMLDEVLDAGPAEPGTGPRVLHGAIPAVVLR